jgi:hypothetical protein
VIDAAEVADLPFSGGKFKFSGSGLKLIHRRAEGDPSMRVDSRPAGPEVDLTEDVWLGVGGRLLTFQHESGQSTTEPVTDSTNKSVTENDETGIGDASPAGTGD